MEQPIRAADLTADRHYGEDPGRGPVDQDGADWRPAPLEPADEDLDLLGPNRRLGRLTVLLLAGILVAVAFVGGVAVQKHYGGSTTTAASGRTGTGSGFARQFGGGTGGAGGFGGFGGGTGGTGTGTGGAGTGGGTGGGGAAAADTPAVVGQVVKVSGTTITVKNFAGKLLTVKVPAGTTITLSTTLSLTGLKAGTAVAVVGTTASDGTVTASSVTARK